MNHTIVKRMTVGAMAFGVAVGLAATAPGVAYATPSTTSTTSSVSSAGSAQPSNPICTPSAFSASQQQVEAELTGRVTQLNALLSEVNNTANHLTTSDRQTLATDISTVELPGIQGLLTHVQQDTICLELRADARAMVLDYRVYMVMTPQTHLTIVADDETSIEGVFESYVPTITAAIQRAQALGHDVTAAQNAFTDMSDQVTAAQTATTGLDVQLLAQTPQGAPGNWQVFLAARTSVTNARDDLRAAYADAQQIKADLQ